VKSIPLHPGYAGFTAVVGGLAGLLGSIYSAQIGTVAPFSYLLRDEWKDTVGPVIAVVLFLLTLFAFGLMFGAGFRAQLRAQDEATDRLDAGMASAGVKFTEQLDRLESTLRSLPPAGFLVEFEDQFHTAFSIASEALACSEEKNLEEQLSNAIHACLAAMLLLAAAYDPPSKGVRYTVNLMALRKVPDGAPDRESFRARLQLFEPSGSLDGLEGGLELVPRFMLTLLPSEADLSSVTPEDQSDADATAQAIILPVPKPEFRMDAGRTTVLPGAPAAWCSSGTLQYFPDVANLVDALRTQTALRPSVATAAEKYFAEHEVGRSVKSFIALPFGLPADEPGTYVTRYGVVNVHSSATGLLGQNEASLYAPLTSPLRALLGLLWQRWEAAEFHVAKS